METKYPDALTIQQYLEGKLDPEVMHQLEKQALDDPFLWDALEGYSVYRDPAADLSLLQRQLHERIVHLQENKKVFDLSWQRLSVAAAAAVMFVSAGILFWMNSPKPDDRLASESNTAVEVNVIDKDSIETVIRAKEQPLVASLDDGKSVPAHPEVSAHEPAGPEQPRAVLSAPGESKTKRQGAPEGEAVAPTISYSASARTVARPEEEIGVSGRSGDVMINNARPKSGWDAYKKYIRFNTGKFKEVPALSGEVLLSFEIDASGKPLNIKVIKGLSEAYNREAIRIVKDGSSWVPSSEEQNTPVQITLNF